MLGQSPVCATIAVSDANRAKEFYGDTLGLTLESEDPWGMVFASGPSKLFVYKSQFAGTNRATYASWTVDDIEACVEDLKSRGITFEQYDLPQTTWEGDIAVSGEVKSAWFKDPDGNILNLNTGEI